MLTRKFMTVREVANLTRVSEATVRHWIKVGELRAINVGREFRIIPRDFEGFLERHATRAARVPDDDRDKTDGLTTQDPSGPPPSAPAASGRSLPRQKGVAAANAREEGTQARKKAKASGSRPTRTAT